jgi:hypothetical protein
MVWNKTLKKLFLITSSETYKDFYGEKIQKI